MFQKGLNRRDLDLLPDQGARAAEAVKVVPAAKGSENLNKGIIVELRLDVTPVRNFTGENVGFGVKVVSSVERLDILLRIVQIIDVFTVERWGT